MVWNTSLKREIPDGWQETLLSELCDFKNGINYEKNQIGDKYKIVNVRNISDCTLILNEFDLDEINLDKKEGTKYLLKDKDILVARSGIPGAVRLLLAPSDNVVYCGFSICCTPRDDSLKNYIAFYLKQFEGTSATKTGGSILENVSQNTLGRLRVVMPNKSNIDLYNKKVNPILKSIDRTIKENNKLKQIKDFILPLLMNGQVTLEN